MTRAPAPEASVLAALPELADWSVIARGAQAEVWRAFQPLLGRYVAVKVSLDRIDVDGELAFRRECAALGILASHDAIISVHDALVTSDRRAVLVMTLAEGGSLADRLGQEGPFPPSRVAQIGRTIASALAAAHEAGVIHLDVKPANILLDALGRPMLGDFGITELDGARGGRTTFMRTPAYAAPEVLRGERPSPKADVWGLGATLAALLLGHSPCRHAEADDARLIEHRAVTGTIPDLRPLGAPEPLEKALRAAMSTDPTQRPDMRKLRELLGGPPAASSGDDVTQEPVGTARPFLHAHRLASGRGRAAPLAAVAGTAAVIVLGYSSLAPTAECGELRPIPVDSMSIASPPDAPGPIPPTPGFDYGEEFDVSDVDATRFSSAGGIVVERVADGSRLEVYEYTSKSPPAESLGDFVDAQIEAGAATGISDDRSWCAVVPRSGDDSAGIATTTNSILFVSSDDAGTVEQYFDTIRGDS